MHKEDLRLLIGSSLQSAGLTEPFRKLYTWVAKSYLWNFKTETIKAAWIRRSLVTSDFVPVCSDIDMTILIDDQRLEEIALANRFTKFHPVRDVQFVGLRFFKAWKDAGGFRNRQFENWKQIHGIKLELKCPPKVTKEELAFEMGYEVHLLYLQIQSKLKTIRIHHSDQNKKSLLKLLREMERLRLYWENGDKRLITLHRENIPFNYSILSYFEIMDNFWSELLKSLTPPLDTFEWKDMVSSIDSKGFEINVEIAQQRVFIPNNCRDLWDTLLSHQNNFICSSNFLKLIKGIGLQEQTLLNELAAQKNTYYLNFSMQRLAHDLLGAILLSPDNHEQLYYCFANINAFCLEVQKSNSPFWEEIYQSWQLTKRLPYSHPDLIKVCMANLDQIAAIP
jgi:hypothetical protein